MSIDPKRAFAIFSLVVAPLLLTGIELFHPAHFTLDPGMTSFLSQPQSGDPYFKALHYFGPDWWFLLHMLQTPLVVIVAFGLLQMTDTFWPDAQARFKPLAWLARLATVVFMTFYTVLDGIGGIALGRELVVLNELIQSKVITTADAQVIRAFLDRMWVDPWVGGVGSFISQVGSWSVFVAALCIGGYLALNRKATWLEVALLLGFGWELQVAHASYHGPIAFTLLALASALRISRKTPGRSYVSARLNA
ncbi:MAG: hypothetical protein JWN94_4283 [Betaproteobacteria bacterium]|nr:hypothetical protein [Betaproteobacteria bacterium]